MSESLSGQAQELQTTIGFFRTARADGDSGVEPGADVAALAAPVPQLTHAQHAENPKLRLHEPAERLMPRSGSRAAPRDGAATNDEIERGDFRRY